jgi:hemolysin activation/secretion protein
LVVSLTFADICSYVNFELQICDSDETFIRKIMRNDSLGVVVVTAALLVTAGVRDARGDGSVAVPPVGALRAPVAGRAVEKPKAKSFDIWEIAVDGNTVVDDSDIQDTLAPYLGPGKTAGDVDKAREALQSLYRELGFQTVAVGIAVESRKTFQDGLIILKVDEGRIHKLSVSGARYYSIDRIREQVPSLEEGQVPDFEAVQQDIAGLNRLPDRQVAPTLKRDDATNSLDVDLGVTDSLPLHGLLEVNNRASSGTSRLRAMANISYDNMFQRGDSLSLMLQNAPLRPSDGQVFYGGYLMHTDDPYFSLQFSVLDSRSDVASLGGTDVVGRGRSVGAKGLWQVPGGNGWMHSIAAGIEFKDFLNKVNFGGSSLESPLIYYPLTLSWEASRQGDTHTAKYGIDVMTAVPRLGSDSASIDQSRYGARRQMHYLRASTSHSLELPRSFQLSVNASAQATDVPLVSNEQISLGGMDSARGYFEAESTGDRGLLGSVELHTPQLSLLFAERNWASHVNEGTAFIFVDAGHVSLRGPLPDTSQRNHADLHSVGAGVNLGVFSHFNTVIEWADPLVAGPYTKKNDNRVLFRVWGTF